MQQFGIVYRLTNLVNGRAYIGQTTRSLTQRFNAHCCKNSRVMLIGRAIHKYGRDQFSQQVLFIATDQASLNDAETALILDYQSLSPGGYNIRPGGNKQPLAEETKLKISASLKGKTKSSEHIENAKNALRQRHPSAERSAQIIAMNKSESHKKKCALGNLGKRRSDIGRKNMSESRKAYFSDPGNRLKASLASKGKPWSAARRAAQEKNQTVVALTS